MAKILIADDDAHMLRVLSMWLVRNGHDVLEASNGEQAQTILANTDVDLMISDVNMPGTDGFGLIKWLRQHKDRNLPAMLLTSRCDQKSIADRLEPYDVHIHPKPFSPSRLVVEIERLLAPVMTDEPA